MRSPTIWETSTLDTLLKELNSFWNVKSVTEKKKMLDGQVVE